MKPIGPVETLARLCLQSDRYQRDPDYRDAVDAVLGHPVYDAGPELLKACRAALPVMLDAHAALTAEVLAGHGRGRCRGGCPDLEAIARLEAAITAAEGKP